MLVRLGLKTQQFFTVECRPAAPYFTEKNRARLSDTEYSLKNREDAKYLAPTDFF